MRAKITEFIYDEFVEDESMKITDDTPLISSGLVDSFSMVSLKAYIEEEYGLLLSDDEATTEAFDTVSKIVALIKGKQGG
jgi:acyl carrier protein/D-alanine--poly(phosphoribitol) ligase subunit 2